MKIELIRAFSGASVYSHRPVTLMEIDLGELRGKESREIENFNQKLLELLPGLHEHFCNRARPGGFAERLEEGTHFNHVVEHVALELLSLAGFECRDGRFCGGSETDDSRAVIETTMVETARYVMPVAADLTEAVLEEETFSVEKKVLRAQTIAAETKLDAGAAAVVAAAERREIPWRLESPSKVIQLGYGKNLHFVRGAATDRTSLVGVDLAKDKIALKERLLDFSIPVPEGEIVETEDEAVDALDYLGAPVVVRPLEGGRGRQISLALETSEEVAAAFRSAREFSRIILVEESFAGKNYRALVVGGKLVAASELAADDPAAGGAARDVTDEVHPTVKTLCERTARVVGLDVCGVDLVVEDVSAPMPEEKGGVIEIDGEPDLSIYAPTRDAGGAVVEMLYPNGSPSRIPIISVTGTNGKTTVTRMISHVLNDGSRTVGTTTSTGIFLNGEQIVRGDTTGPISARTVLGDRSVDVAVLETARGGIVRRGLAYDWSDVSVITNISEDHIGQDGINSVDDLINIKSLVAERLREGGTLILNADDETSKKVLEREKVKNLERKIVYFSLEENNPRVLEHIENGGTAFVRQNDSIVEIVGKETHPLVDAREIPATLGGTADFQIANSMAAIAACRAFGLAREQIAGRLKTFRTDADNPGRNNLYKVGQGHVLVDYGHNTDGFAAICRMIGRLEGRTSTGIISIAGDREDRFVKEAAAIAARCFDRIIATDDVDLRGREPGEISRLICEAVGETAPECRCEIITDEIEAVSKAIGEMRENEIIVIFYDRLSEILDILQKNGAVAVSSFEESASGTVG